MKIGGLQCPVHSLDVFPNVTFGGAIGLTLKIYFNIRQRMQCNVLWHGLDKSSIETYSIVFRIKTLKGKDDD